MPKRLLYNKGKLMNAWVPEELAEDATKIAALKSQKISDIIRKALRVYVNENLDTLKAYNQIKENNL